MNINVIDLFPVPLAVFSNVLTKQQLCNIKEYLRARTDSLSSHVAVEGDGASSHGYHAKIFNLIEQEATGCANLSATIQEVLDEYTKGYGISSVMLTNSWFNVQRPGSTLKSHIHPDSVISGVIYVDVDPSRDNISFKNPNNLVEYFSRCTHHTDYNSLQYDFTPTTGDILVFPSWIPHGNTYDADHEIDRIAIGFNTIYNR